MNKDAINIKNKEGTAAASNKSSEAEIYAVVAKVSKLKGLKIRVIGSCLLYTSPSPRDVEESRMPSSA